MFNQQLYIYQDRSSGMVAQETVVGVEKYINTVYISPKGGIRLHVPFDTGPLCGEPSASKKKSLDVYPPNHRSWCKNCLSLWNESKKSIIRQCGYLP